MENIKSYISTQGRGVLPNQQYLDSLIKEFPWFGTARMLRSRVTGIIDPLSAMSLYAKPIPRFFAHELDYDDVMRRSDREIIESFLQSGEHRIVPDDSTPEILEDVPYSELPSDKPVFVVGGLSKADEPLKVECVEDEEDKIVEAECGETPEGAVTSDKPQSELVVSFLPVEDDEFVTEELAQIYLDQELFDQAKAIYSRLSLLNPEKSIYFAEIINRIELFKMARQQEE